MIKIILYAIWITYTIAVTREFLKVVNMANELTQSSRQFYITVRSYFELENIINNSKDTLTKKQYEQLKKDLLQLQNEMYKEFNKNNLM